MRERLFQLLLRPILDHPRLVLVVAALLTVGAALLIPGLRVEAGHKSLSAPDSPAFVKLDAFLHEFGSPNQLVLMVEGGSEPLRQAVIDRLLVDLPAPTVSEHPEACAENAPPNAPGCVRDVVGHIDLEKFADHGLLFLDEDALGRVVTALEDPQMGVATLRRVDSVATLLDKLAAGIEARADNDAPEGDARDRAQRAMKGLGQLLDTMAGRLEDPERLATPLDEELMDSAGETAGSMRGIDRDGYFSSDDGSLKLGIVRPMVETDKPRPVLAFVGYVRARTEAAIEAVGGVCAAADPDPTACPDGRMRAAFTGMPALIADETVTLNRDLTLTSVIAFVGVALLFAIGFRSASSALLGLAPLVIALVWTLAFVRVFFGSLNLLTASFVATLLGLGIDFAVHTLARYQEARREAASPAEAVEAALRSAGPGVLTGGLTTAGAFLALAPVEFKAFSELGIMTAFGLVVALLATFTVLPASLVIPRFERLQGRLHHAPPPSTRRGVPEWVVSHPWVFVIGGIALAAAMAVQGERLHWNYDYTSLMPDGAPSVAAWDTLRERTDYTAEAASIVAKDEAQAREFTRQLEALDSVARVDSALSYVPRDQSAKLATLAKLAPLVGAPDGDARPAAQVDLERTRTAAQDLADSLEDARFEAARGGAEEAHWLDPPVEGARRLKAALAGLEGDAGQARLHALQDQLIALRDRALASLRNVTNGQRLSAAELIEDLPQGLQDRLYHQGRFALYIYPSADIGQRTFRRSFVNDIESVSDTATGFPVTHWYSNQAIEAGFREATLLATLAILILLFIDFRNVRSTLLALIPLAVGITWAWGGMGLLNMHYNPANIIAFPLVLGIGVDTGVHILHRWHQEHDGDIAAVVRTTGRAIFLSTATTMVGFGSLVLARHRGMSSLGTVLLLGVGACLVTSIFVLPAVLSLIKHRRHPRAR